MTCVKAVTDEPQQSDIFMAHDPDRNVGIDLYHMFDRFGIDRSRL